MITSEWSDMLKTLFNQMYKDRKRCENWDTIMICHDQEDIDYFEMLAQRMDKFYANQQEATQWQQQSKN